MKRNNWLNKGDWFCYFNGMIYANKLTNITLRIYNKGQILKELQQL